MKDKITAEKIVDNIVGCRISKEDAISAIEKLVQQAINEEIGYMGATEYRYYIGVCKEYYKNYGYSIKGNMDEFKEIVQQAIEICGFDKFEEIRNTKENRQKIKDVIDDNSQRFFG